MGSRHFFAVHSYCALFIKLLALQVANFLLMPKMGSGLRRSSLCRFRDTLKREVEPRQVSRPRPQDSRSLPR
jgi:hypothetical protein